MTKKIGFTNPALLRPLKWVQGIFRDIGREMKEHRLPLIAGSLSYTTILSIVPLLAVSFAIFKAFGGLDRLLEDVVQPFVLQNLAQGANQATMEALQSFIKNAHATTIGVSGLVGLIFTSISMLNSAEKAIHSIWDEPIRRSWFERVATYWMFITLGPIALSVALGAASSNNFATAQKFFPAGAPLFGLATFFLFIVYKLVPHRAVHWRPTLIAALSAASAWVLARSLYGVYVKKVVSYDRLYGSLGAIPVLMLWIWVIWLIVLGGVAMSAALQKRMEQK